MSSIWRRRPRCSFWLTRDDRDAVLRELGALWAGESRARSFLGLWPLVVFIRCAEALAPELAGAYSALAEPPGPDPRYRYVLCPKCLRRWQRIDYGCALHQLVCGYPVPAPAAGAWGGAA